MIAPRSRPRLLFALTACAAAAVTVLPHASAATAAPQPGPTKPAQVLESGVQLDGYDVATDSRGTTYVGWISDAAVGTGTTRLAHLCTLPPGASACAGGVATTPAMDDASAGGTRVLALPGGGVEMVWFRNVLPDAETDPQGARITGWIPSAGGPRDLTDAPSFGSMLDAGISPSGQLWAVTYATEASPVFEVRRSTDASQTAFVPVAAPSAPWAVGFAKLAFTGATTALAVQKAGSITVPPAVAASVGGGGFGGFTSVAKTWTAGADVGLVGTSKGLKLVTSQADARYHPVSLTLGVVKGGALTASTPALTGDTGNCGPTSHDTVTDASGRVADVSIECSNIAVTNLADTRHASVVRFGAGGTTAGGSPRIGTSASGRGWVAWSIDVPDVTGNQLRIAPVLLPALTTTSSNLARGGVGTVTVTGPASCLPPVLTAQGVGAKATRGWTVTKRTLVLGSPKTTPAAQTSTTLDGSRLTPGATYTLTATATFTKAATVRTKEPTAVTQSARLTLRACPRP